MQLKIEVDPEDSSLLRGFAVTYSNQFQVYGRRRRSKDADGDFEEFDIVISRDGWLFKEWDAARLVGRFIEDAVLVGSWENFSFKWAAREEYDAHPFDFHPQTGVREGVKLEGGVEGEGKNAGTKEEPNKSQEEEVEIVEQEQQTDEEVTPEMTKDSMDQAEDKGAAERQIQRSAAEGEPESNGTGAMSGEETVKSTTTSAEEEKEEGEGEGEGEGEEEEEEEGTFRFRCIPVETYRFRHILDGDQNKAKARWHFLRETVLHLVRVRLWSWNHLKTWGVDRRAFLDCYRRDWLHQRRFAIHNPLTEEELGAWQTLKYRLPPGMISLCVGSLAWSLRKLPFHQYVL